MKTSTFQIAFIMIMILSNLKVNGQADVLSHIRSTGQYLGWSTFNTGQAGALEIKSDINNSGTIYPIDFYINTNKVATLTTVGDLNITGSSNSYKIGTNPVLWYGASSNDIFVGVGAGNGTMSGHNNTLIGKNAGTVIGSGSSNTAIGYSAGTAITTGNSNTLIGRDAGSAITTGGSNTSIGKDAGLAITTSVGNTYTGFEAGSSFQTGSPNTAVGYQALKSATYGLNTAVGYQALSALTGSCGSCEDLGNLNTAVGFQALTNTQAYGGCALGFWAGRGNTYGCRVIAIGEVALYTNSTGNDNIAIGQAALYFNTQINYNIAIGRSALKNQAYGADMNAQNIAVGNAALWTNNPTTTSNGIKNVAVGDSALFSNTYGAFNTAMGFKATFAATTANYNSSLGVLALGLTTSGGLNTGIGFHAGYDNTSGTKNTYLGYHASANAGTYSNSAAIGYNAVALNGDNMYFGDANVQACLNLAGSWGQGSDGRFKVNVQENVSGLDFIKRLRPVTYNWNAQALDAFVHQNQAPRLDIEGNVIPQDDFTAASSVVHSGFIAQEVEQASLDAGFTSTIVSAPANASDIYTLNYSEIVVPLVKAVKELDAANLALQTQLTALQDQVNGCCAPQRTLSPENGSLNQDQEKSIAIDVTLSTKSIVLDQNQPNPFKEQTTITYFIPDDAKNVIIIFTDSRSNVLKEVLISEKGKGHLNVYAQDLSSGTYTYTIVADGVTVDTKKMVCTK